MNNLGVTTTHSTSTTNDAFNVFIYILEYNVMLSVCVCVKVLLEKGKYIIQDYHISLRMIKYAPCPT